MDLTHAIERHSQCKEPLRDAIDLQEPLDAASACRDDLCELGQWLHDARQCRLAGFRAFDDCLLTHAHFHAEAGRVAELVNAKDFVAAAAAIGVDSPYHAASKAVCFALVRLKQEVRRSVELHAPWLPAANSDGHGGRSSSSHR